MGNLFSTFFGKPASIDKRLNTFPRECFGLHRSLSIYWNEYQVPFIDAKSDHDVAFGLGLVHAHLRGGQVAVFKRIAQGRVSEMIGPVGIFIDKAIRTLDFAQATPSIMTKLAPDTKTWLKAFVQGLNEYQTTAKDLPLEYRILGLKREPYTCEDIITLSRMFGNDVNWPYFFQLLGDRQRAGWPRVWERVLSLGSDSATSFPNDKRLNVISNLLTGLSRSGSNSMVVSAKKSATGHGMIANDPHLGIHLPNLWLLTGYHSPSYNVTGLMLPGMPFCALGRNPFLAWGGTNMRASSSDLYDVSKLPKDQFRKKKHTLKVRFFGKKTFETTQTPFGPELTEVPFIKKKPGERLAIRWAGAEPFNELDAFLRANRAQTPKQFRDAFKGYGVSGQNMLCVDNRGNIALTLAVKLPKRKNSTPNDMVLDASQPQNDWDGFCDATELPWIHNPDEGFIASANNRTVATDPPLSFFFGQSERIERLRELLLAKKKLSRDDLKAIQQDVYSKAAERICQMHCHFLKSLHIVKVDTAFYMTLRNWDGFYHTDSAGASAFELLNYYLLKELNRGPRKKSYYYQTWNYISHYLQEDLEAMPDKKLSAYYQRALIKASNDHLKFPRWGCMHRLQVEHLLAHIPGIGKLFSFGDIQASGSRQTIMKSDHGLKHKRGITNYGSQSRQISIMDDIDNNYFVLFGGQDGWLFSEGITDQIQLWKKGAYMRLPLRPDTARREYAYEMHISAHGRPSELAFLKKRIPRKSTKRQNTAF